MKPYRKEKISSLIQEELSKLIERELEFNDTIVTITEVEISDDLSQAKIKLAIYPNHKELEVFSIIEKNRRQLQRKLFQKINIKPMPQLKFEIQKNKMAW